MGCRHRSRFSDRCTSATLGDDENEKDSAMPDRMQQVTPGDLIAGMPSRWDRLRATVKVAATAITGRRNKIITLSEDGKNIVLTDADKFADEPESETRQSAAPGAESGA
jgi:hypothetical protein